MEHPRIDKTTALDTRQKTTVDRRGAPSIIQSHSKVCSRGLGYLAACIDEDHVIGIEVAVAAFVVSAAVRGLVEQADVGGIDRHVVDAQPNNGDSGGVLRERMVFDRR